MGKPIIIKSRLVPKHLCVNLFGTLWARDTSWINDKVINHERIHTAQQRELLFIFFYVLYLIEWFIRFVRYRNWTQAYLNTSFEKEAYTHGDNLNYLSQRHHYAQWLKHPTTQQH